MPIQATHTLPHFACNHNDAQLFAELRKRVQQALAPISAKRQRPARIKAVLLPVIYFGLYSIALWSDSYAFFLLLIL